MRAVAAYGLTLTLACAGAACAGPIGVLGRDDQPQTLSARLPPVVHAHNDSTIELPSDEQIVEPSHPAVGSPQEKALAHVHTPNGGVCSGVVVGDRMVMTAHQCVSDETRAATAGQDFYVEVASSTLTWTKRRVVHALVPSCVWEKLDVAVLVVTDPIEWVKPLKVMTSPQAGTGIQALGFGRCAGDNRGLSRRFGEILRRENDALVVDLPLCRGDVGGPLVERATGELLGLISHQDDPDGVVHRTTTIVRLDTSPARALVAQAQALLNGGDATKLEAVSCD